MALTELSDNTVRQLIRSLDELTDALTSGRGSVGNSSRSSGDPPIRPRSRRDDATSGTYFDNYMKAISQKYEQILAELDKESKKYNKDSNVMSEIIAKKEAILKALADEQKLSNVARSVKEQETNIYKRSAIIYQARLKAEEAIKNAFTDQERIAARRIAQDTAAVDFENKRLIAAQKMNAEDRATRKEAVSQRRKLDAEEARYNLEKAKQNKEDAKNWVAMANLRKKALIDQGASAEELKDAQDEVIAANKALAISKKEERSNALASWGSNLKESFTKTFTSTEAKDVEARSKAMAAFTEKANNEISRYIDDAMSHRRKVMARLQGVGGGEYDYDALLNLVSNNLAASPFVKQQDYLNNLDKAVAAGIAYNVEQRTFLATISESISDTFDAFNSELLRLIKLQQSDSTAARLGMEAAIQRGLNNAFSDSSYMTSQYQNVSGALLGAESLMSRNEAVEFEYMVQKWLGALYSLGLSDSSVNMIASAINALGTGDVTTLANSPMQTLFAMAASRSGNLDYAKALTNGLNASGINDLMKSMVEYLQQIAEESGNNVVKSAYKDLYQISLSDLKAVSSLTNKEIENIYNQSLGYSGAEGELNKQLSNLSKRFSIGEMTQNLIANFKYGIGSDIASSPAQYITWELADLIKSTTGGIHLPAISVMGNMVDLSAFTIEGLMQTAMVGISTISQLGSIIKGLGSWLNPSLSVWGGTETTTRGGFLETTSGFSRQTSQSQYVGSSSAEDMRNETLSSATEDAQDVADITNANADTEYTFDDFYKAIYEENLPIPVSLETMGKNGDEIITSLMNVVKLLDEALSDSINVNITGASTSVPMMLQSTSAEISNNYKTFTTKELAKAIAEEIKSTSFGYDRRNSGDSIAETMQRISEGDIEVKVTQIFDASNARTFGREMIIP